MVRDKYTWLENLVLEAEGHMQTATSAQRMQRSLAASSPELSLLIARKDWAQTPLGQIGQWSPALRMTVDHVLANGFGLLLWWGPQYLQIYNDAYRPVLGTKHPKSLGQPAAECFSEIWETIGPMVDRPFHGGSPSVMDDLHLEVHRHGFLEETHFTVAYSPVFDPTVEGGIGGVLATVHETTKKVIGERRIRLLSDLSSQTAQAKTGEEACAIAARTLESDPQDVPFAALYLLDRSAEIARLAAIVGIAPHGERPSTKILLKNGDQRAIAEMISSERSVVMENGRALAVPIFASLPHEFAGFIIAHVSPRLALDEDYKGFFDLAAAHVATAITNARAYEEERRRAEALAEIDRAKSAFFSNVSHEFRTPLTLMLGPLTELAKTATGDAASLIDTARRNTLRLRKLVNTLLDFSRIEAGRAEARFAKTDLAALTQDLCSSFRSAIESSGLMFSVDVTLREYVFVDRAMWEKIVLNLLSNALKYTLDGGIRVTLQKAGTHVELRVEDTGSGIPQSELPHIFERFHRVRAAQARSDEGSGIGLALTKDLVSLHCGSIDVESAFGQGSTFRVRLPLGSSHLERASIAHEANSRPSGGIIDEYLAEIQATTSPSTHPAQVHDDEGGAARAHILVADDNRDLRDHLMRILGPHYNVDVVSDGVEALACARERTYDMIVCDIMMPNMDGLELLRTIRTDERLASTPFILLSARAGEESAIEGLQLGADEYLVKPFSADDLRARIEAQLQSAQRRDEGGLKRTLQRWFEHAGESDVADTVFRLFANQLPIIVYQQDPAGSLSFLNDAYYDTFDQPRDATTLTLSGQFKILHPEDTDRIVRIVSESIGTRAAYELEYRLKHSDAGAPYRWYLARAIPQFNSDGSFHGWIGTIIDIDEAKRREEAEKSIRERETQIARAFQDAALPTAHPDVPGLTFSALYEPAEKNQRVGGDFYDVFRLQDGRVVVAIGDVAGSGVTAATTMSAVRQSMRAAASIDPNPAHMLKAADNVFADLRTAMFASAFVAVLDPLTFVMQYAAAGHPPALLRNHDGTILELLTGDLLLGVPADGTPERRVVTHAMERGSTLVLYTDGLTEARHNPDEGERLLKRALSTLDTTADRAANALRDGVLGAAATSEDDLAVLTVFFREPIDEAAETKVLCRQLASDDEAAAHRVRREITARLRHRGMSQEDLFAAEVIFSELIGNAVRHAHTRIDVALDLTMTYAVLHVLDSGPGFSLNPKLPTQLFDEQGRGLYIAARLAREFTADPRKLTSGTHARAVLRGALDASQTK